MSTNFSCPACGADVKFKARSSLFGTCPFCKSTLVRHDSQLENLGQIANLTSGLSVLQLGTKGRFQNKTFELVGQVRFDWEQGSWNEWFAVFETGLEGWLGEAQGFYSFGFSCEPFLSVPVETLLPGHGLSIQGQTFRVSDIKKAIIAGYEGELPTHATKGRPSLCVDLLGQNKTYANIDSSAEETRFFVGQYVDFETFQFTNLREIDGW